MLKRGLVSPDFVPDEFKMKWEGVIRTLTKDDFARAFRSV
jgi:hypothetical protein